jgi:hypothetical protein
MIEGERVKPKLLGEVVKKGEKYFVSVYTPFGKPDAAPYDVRS